MKLCSKHVANGVVGVTCGTAVMVLCALAGCSSGPGPAAYATEYPASVRQGDTLDIQVVRRSQRVAMTNTTATNFGPSRLWLNRRFSQPIEGWKIGETLDFHLSSFVDEFGETFRPGGFFAAEAPDKIVHAQIETPRWNGEESPVDGASVKMLGLIVVTPTE